MIKLKTKPNIFSFMYLISIYIFFFYLDNISTNSKSCDGFEKTT